MPRHAMAVAGQRYTFHDVPALLAVASTARSGDELAGLAAESPRHRFAARAIIADLPLKIFLEEPVIPYDRDEVTRLILDTHDKVAFAPIASLTVGEFREWLLSDAVNSEMLARTAPGITPEMAAAVSRLMNNQDLVSVARKCRVITAMRATIGLENTLCSRLQPNHPQDDPAGILAAILDGLVMCSGDAVIGINPATDNIQTCMRLATLVDDLRQRLDAPLHGCVLTHVTNSICMIERGAPVDLVFQSVAGSQAANDAFGVNLSVLREAHDAALSLRRGEKGHNVMYFETGQGAALSSNAHHGVDQQTMEARAYAVARAFQPLLVNSVVGFIGPEYLADGKQIIRAGLEDHFCGKLLGLPMGADVCYTTHSDADRDDMDVLATMLAAAGVNFLIAVPGAEDVMLNYQSLSFQDISYLRRLLNLQPAPEFASWLQRTGLSQEAGMSLPYQDPSRILSMLAVGGTA